MRIAVDGTTLWGLRRYSGVEKVVDRILYRLALEPRQHQIRILVPSDWGGFEAPVESPENPQGAEDRIQTVVERLPFSGSHKLRRIVWQQFVFPEWLQQWKADLVFCPTYIMPLRSPCPAAVIVHDLHGLRLRQTRWANFLHYRLLLPPTLRRASVVLTPTQVVMNEVRPYLSPHGRTANVPWGIDEFFTPLPGHNGTAVPPYILFVGNMEKRKGLLMLLESYAALRSSHPALELTLAGKDLGQLPALRREVIRLGVGNQVRFTGFVSNEELLNLYRGAALLAMTSEAEGFGITPLEAMACGTPVVAVDTPAARENLGDAAVYATAKVASLSKTIGNLLDDPERRRQLAAAGRKQAALFTWDRTMDGIWRALELD